MNLRDCEGLYKCCQGTDEKCRKALCPFYKPPKKEKQGRYVLDDFSGLWKWEETNEADQNI